MTRNGLTGVIARAAFAHLGTQGRLPLLSDQETESLAEAIILAMAKADYRFIAGDHVLELTEVLRACGYRVEKMGD